MTRLELLARNPPAALPQSLGELGPADDVWVERVEFGATAHRCAGRQVAACGTSVCRQVAVENLVRLSGSLCPACWTPAGTGGDR